MVIKIVSTTRKRLASARLYGIADLGYLAETALDGAVAALLEGGVDLLQLRAKGRETAFILKLARRLAPLCREAGVPFIVNDHLAVARDSGADGVHLGQDDGDLSAARSALPAGAIVGRSTHSPAQARTALAEGADYIGFGPLFPTPTKEGRPAIGLEEVAAVQAALGAHLPMFCIGGIKLENLPAVLAAGARRVVIVSGLLQARDIVQRCRQVRELLESAC